MLTAVFIKGFKTFARPVRMPLEGGVTAVVGPNGSGKSNITDAVLFALGEQSPATLRAGAMGDLIFSGSDTLGASAVAEVTLALDNSDGAISLPYEEVAITRRISRGGETEYRINGARSRLADVRAVAGEAGLGRHSVLRQGAVDAIVAGGAAACRLALEEAAGLGVYRRRRQTAARRLERADAQLEKSRQLEAEISAQLQRIEREAAAAREYRELEARYRKLSLAGLYRAAARDLETPRERLEQQRTHVRELSEKEQSIRDQEAALNPRLHRLATEVRVVESRLESLEDVLEDLRLEAARADRALVRLEAGRDREAGREHQLSNLRSALLSTDETLEGLEGSRDDVEREHAHRKEELSRTRASVARVREEYAASEGLRNRLAARSEGLRSSLDRGLSDEAPTMDEGNIIRLTEAVRNLEDAPVDRREADTDDLRRKTGDLRRVVAGRTSEADRRRGALGAELGAVEARVRALRENGSAADGTRLHEVIRARPGFETAVEAALGEMGGGLLARDLDEGMSLLSDAERVALRLDAEVLEAHGPASGKPLTECVSVLDSSYEEAVGRLLGGIYVIDGPAREAPANGYVAVTRDGIRLTRTSVSRRSLEGDFTREARLFRELSRQRALEEGPATRLENIVRDLSATSRTLEELNAGVEKTTTLADRAGRAAALLLGEARGRRDRAEASLQRASARAAKLQKTRRDLETTQYDLREAEARAGDLARQLSEATTASDEAQRAFWEADQRRAQLDSTIHATRDRHSKLTAALQRLQDRPASDTERAVRLVTRVVGSSRQTVDAATDRRTALRQHRAQTSEEHHEASVESTDLARKAATLAGEQAAARATSDRLEEDLRRAERSAAAAGEEIASEWGATLEDAREEARNAPKDAEAERARLARRLKRFGDVNLLALSQEGQLRERHDFVAEQRADAEAATNDLQRIIQNIDEEIEGRFAETFRRVREGFGDMVPRMIGGASGRLELSEEGVEIGLRLGRRGWRPLRVLSGGERALLALSFLFSILIGRPEGPGRTFCILDEAEAALDDVNLARFLAVVDSHRSGGQFLLVTHQKRTMAAADVLYGVTQDAAGATVIVSKRLTGE